MKDQKRRSPVGKEKNSTAGRGEGRDARRAGEKGGAATGDDIREHLLAQLDQTHARFVELMTLRLANANAEEIERYFGLLSSLVAKLEDSDKSLKDVLREMAAEYAAIILMELNS